MKYTTNRLWLWALLTLSLFMSGCITTKRAPIDRKQDVAKPAVNTPALAVLQSDFDRAQRQLDLRGMLVANVVANNVHKKDLAGHAAAYLKLKSRIFGGEQIPKPVWHVSRVTGKWLDGGYKDLSTSIRPKPGFRLLHVSATVENTSEEVDPPYIAFAFANFKRELMESGLIAALNEESSQKGRLLDQEFLWVLTPGGDMLPVSYALDGFGTLRITGPTASTTIGKYLKKGVRVNIAVLFTAPEGMQQLRFWVLGANPVPIRVTESSTPRT